jgi:hypothetical protein
MRLTPTEQTSAPLASRIETWALDRLVPYAKNPRKNDPAVERNVLLHQGVRV